MRPTGLTSIEREKRIQAVMHWLVQDYPVSKIIEQILSYGWCKERQARALLATARKRWTELTTDDLHEMRAMKVIEFQERKRQIREDQSLKSYHKYKLLNEIDEKICNLLGLNAPIEHNLNHDVKALMSPKVTYIINDPKAIKMREIKSGLIELPNQPNN